MKAGIIPSHTRKIANVGAKEQSKDVAANNNLLYPRSTVVMTLSLPSIFVILSCRLARVESFQICRNALDLVKKYRFHLQHNEWCESLDKCSYCCLSQSSSSAVDKNDHDDEHNMIEDEDDTNARSQFGTRQYWDDMYLGRGDFPAEEYSWYFGWDILKEYVKEYLPDTDLHILCPGIGNDPLLVDLFKAGYCHLTAFDYSEHAIERQEELLSYSLSSKALDTMDLHIMDARKLPVEWTDSFDAIIEKGALDAIYLSGDGNVEQATKELHRVLRPGGICMSISGVVPEDLRREIFAEDWEWLRDGSDELKAGCFALRKVTNA